MGLHYIVKSAIFETAAFAVAIVLFIGGYEGNGLTQDEK